MKRSHFLFCCVLLCALLLCACGAENTQTDADAEVSAPQGGASDPASSEEAPGSPEPSPSAVPYTLSLDAAAPILSEYRP